jgi:O-antigen ligase
VNAASAVTRFLALAGLLLLSAYPVRVALVEPEISLLFKIGWMALLGLGLVRPLAGVVAFVAIVPLVPILPYASASVPHGIIHLLVLSQALPLLARWGVGRRTPPTDPVWIAWLLLVAIGAASVASVHAAYSLAFASRLEFLRELHAHLSAYVLEPPGPTLEYMLVALTAFLDGLLVYAIVRTVPRPQAPRIIAVAGATAAAVSLIGLAQSVTGRGLRPAWIVYDPGITRINATYSDPNALGAYLAFAIPVMVALAGGASTSRGRLSWLVCAGCASLSLVMTASRIAYAGAVVGLLLLGAGAVRLKLDAQDPWPGVRRRFRSALRTAVAGGLASLILLTAVGTVADVRHQHQTSYLETVLYTLNLRQPLDDKLKGRLAIWQTAGLMIQDDPAFGIGLGSMYRQFASYHRSIGTFEPNLRLSAHNTFLNIGAEMGAIGLAAWLALLGLLCATGFRALHEDDRPTAWLRVGLAGGLAAFGVTMLTGDRTILREDLVLLGLAAALVVTFAPAPAVLARRARRWTVLVMLLLALTWPVRAEVQRRNVQLDRISWGFHHPEVTRDGMEYRWTTPNAVFHVPAGARSLTIPLRSLAPRPQRVTVLLNGDVVDEVRLADHAWHRVRYVLPLHRTGTRYIRVELRTRPTWQPEHDARTLGVMVGRHTWE